MKRFLILVGAMAFIFASCQKESQLSQPFEKSTQAKDLTKAKTDLIKLINGANSSSTGQASLYIDGQTVMSPDQAMSILKKKLDLSSIPDFKFNQNIIDRAINAEDYLCESTFVDRYVNEKVADWTFADYFIYAIFGGLSFDYAYLFDNEDGGQYYGSEGQFTNVTNRTFRSLKRFWDIPNDILLRDAHGNIYNDIDKIVKLMVFYGFPEADATEYAYLLQYIFGSEAFMYFNHPLLTFNAFAAPADPYFGTGKKIVMGDGIQEAFAEMGYGDVATQALLSHEYAHHVMFAKNIDYGYDPEGVRRGELIADAMAAYFMTHKNGAAMNWKRVESFLQVFYGIGDCGFTSYGHHGTPNQRFASAMFGYNLANQAQVQGYILTSDKFIELFDMALPEILAPDAH